jgi:hypothetical protein
VRRRPNPLLPNPAGGSTEGDALSCAREGDTDVTGAMLTLGSSRGSPSKRPSRAHARGPIRCQADLGLSAIGDRGDQARNPWAAGTPAGGSPTRGDWVLRPFRIMPRDLFDDDEFVLARLLPLAMRRRGRSLPVVAAHRHLESHTHEAQAGADRHDEAEHGSDWPRHCNLDMHKYGRWPYSRDSDPIIPRWTPIPHEIRA